MKSSLARLSELCNTAQLKYAADDFDDTWIDQMHTLVTDLWPTADRRTAELLVDIMAVTPYPRWMTEFLVPAEQGKLRHAELLIQRFDAIAAVAAEGIAREDGLTRRA